MDLFRGIDVWGGVRAAVLFYLVKSGGATSQVLSPLNDTTQAVSKPFFDAFSNSSVAGCVYEINHEFDSLGNSWVPCHPEDLKEARSPYDESGEEEPKTCRVEVSMRGRTRLLGRGETTLCKGVYVTGDLEERDVIIKSTRGIDNPRAACNKLAKAFISDAVMVALEGNLPEDSPHNNHRTYICYGPGDCHLGGRLEDLNRRNYTETDRAALLKHPFAVCPKAIETELLSREDATLMARTYKVATVIFWTFEPDEQLVRAICSNVTGDLPLVNTQLYSRYGRAPRAIVHDALVSALRGRLPEDSSHNEDLLYFYHGSGECHSGGLFRDLQRRNFSESERGLLAADTFAVFPRALEGIAPSETGGVVPRERGDTTLIQRVYSIVFWEAPRDDAGVCTTVTRKVPFNVLGS
jgi:hypothetical protein